LDCCLQYWRWSGGVGCKGLRRKAPQQNLAKCQNRWQSVTYPPRCKGGQKQRFVPATCIAMESECTYLRKAGPGMKWRLVACVSVPRVRLICSPAWEKVSSLSLDIHPSNNRRSRVPTPLQTNAVTPSHPRRLSTLAQVATSARLFQVPISIVARQTARRRDLLVGKAGRLQERGLETCPKTLWEANNRPA